MDDYRPEWDDRKELADVFQGACRFPVTGLSEDFYTALLRVANWGYDQRKQENTDDQDRAADNNPDVAAMLRLARADAYRQGIKDGRAQQIEELADIVDDTERVRVVLAARRGDATPSAVGTIVTWSQGTVPAGWLLCDGAPIDPAQYPQLAALLDSDNRTPDLRRPGYHNKIIYAGEPTGGN